MTSVPTCSRLLMRAWAPVILMACSFASLLLVVELVGWTGKEKEPPGGELVCARGGWFPGVR